MFTYKSQPMNRKDNPVFSVYNNNTGSFHICKDITDSSTSSPFLFQRQLQFEDSGIVDNSLVSLEGKGNRKLLPSFITEHSTANDQTTRAANNSVGYAFD